MYPCQLHSLIQIRSRLVSQSQDDDEALNQLVIGFICIDPEPSLCFNNWSPRLKCTVNHLLNAFTLCSTALWAPQLPYTMAWIAMKFCTNTSQRMKSAGFSDPVTFPLAPPWVDIFLLICVFVFYAFCIYHLSQSSAVPKCNHKALTVFQFILSLYVYIVLYPFSESIASCLSACFGVFLLARGQYFVFFFVLDNKYTFMPPVTIKPLVIHSCTEKYS